MSAGHIEETRLLALGLGEAPSALESQHLAACAACAASLQEDARLWTDFRALPQPLPPRPFAAGALARYRQARPVRHRPREVAFGAAIVLALVAVRGFWLLRLVPGALVWLALALPQWSDTLSQGLGWSRVLVGVVPIMALAAATLLAAVGLVLRRLTTVVAK